MPKFIIGIDEVGRGPIAGPLCIGACLIRKFESSKFLKMISGIKESKQLSPKERLRWNAVLKDAEKNNHCRLSTVFVREATIDKNGLAFALHLAIFKVLRKFHISPEDAEVLLDGGLKAPKNYIVQKTIIKGDEKEPVIASASIIAKVRRDRYMIRMSKSYPLYNFESHKGYGTPRHFEALKMHGISEVHRKSFLKKFEALNTESPPVF